MANEIVVEPRAPAPAPEAAAPAPMPESAPPAAPEAEGEQGAGLPDELLQIPALQGVFAGSPVAFSATLVDFQKRPEGQLIGKNMKGLQSSGIGLYRSLDGNLGVLFNQLKISGDQIKQADQGGKLLELAPPFDEVNASLGQSGGANPVLAAGAPTGPAAMPPTPPQMGQAPMAGGKAPSAAAQKKVMTARITNSQMGSPTSGPRPGSGRLLNSILKPVV